MNVSKFSKFSTNRHLLLVSFLLLQVTNVCTWKWAEDLEEYLKNGAQLQGMNFLASDDLWDKVCETGTCITSPLFTVDDMNGVERVKEEFKVKILRYDVVNVEPTLPVILCAQRDVDLYYFGQGPWEKSISVYMLVPNATELHCVGIIEDVKFLAENVEAAVVTDKLDEVK